MVKKYRIIVSQEARHSLRRIADYVRKKESDSRAKYIHDELIKAVDRLASFPHSQPSFYESNTNISYRYISKWQFKIIFTVKEEKDLVVVVRLVHDKQDPEQLREFCFKSPYRPLNLVLELPCYMAVAFSKISTVKKIFEEGELNTWILS